MAAPTLQTLNAKLDQVLRELDDLGTKSERIIEHLDCGHSFLGRVVETHQRTEGGGHLDVYFKSTGFSSINAFVRVWTTNAALANNLIGYFQGILAPGVTANAVVNQAILEGRFIDARGKTGFYRTIELNLCFGLGQPLLQVTFQTGVTASYHGLYGEVKLVGDLERLLAGLLQALRGAALAYEYRRRAESQGLAIWHGHTGPDVKALCFVECGDIPKSSQEFVLGPQLLPLNDVLRPANLEGPDGWISKCVAATGGTCRMPAVPNVRDWLDGHSVSIGGTVQNHDNLYGWKAFSYFRFTPPGAPNEMIKFSTLAQRPARLKAYINAGFALAFTLAAALRVDVAFVRPRGWQDI